MASSLPDCSRLFKLLGEGDLDAFRSVFHLFNARLHPFILKVTRSEAITEDLLQETFLRLWIHRSEVAEMDRPESWLYKVASNLSLSYLRKQAVERRKLKEMATPDLEQQTILDDLSSRELQVLLSKAIAQLPPKRQYIYRLCREDGLSYKEIAEQLHISTNTVKNQLVSASRSIKSFLNQTNDIIIPLMILLFLH